MLYVIGKAFSVVITDLNIKWSLTTYFSRKGPIKILTVTFDGFDAPSIFNGKSTEMSIRRSGEGF